MRESSPLPTNPESSQAEEHDNSELWVIVAVISVAAIMLGLVVGLLFRSTHPRRGVDQPEPRDAVLQFMEAVAAGDRDRALSLQLQQASPSVLMSDEALAESRRTAPISQVKVVEETPTAVTITYLAGQSEQRASFTPVRLRDGNWRLQRGTTELNVIRPKQLPLYLNGVHITQDRYEVFPGSYALTTGTNTIEYAEPAFTVAGPASFPRLAPSARLTETGRQAFITAARDRVKVCAEAKELSPAGCPQVVQVNPNQQPVDSTIKWTLLNEDELNGMQPKLTVSDETVAEARVTVRMSVALKVRENGVTGTVDQKLTFVSIAQGGAAAEPITVRFAPQ